MNNKNLIINDKEKFTIINGSCSLNNFNAKALKINVNCIFDNIFIEDFIIANGRFVGKILQDKSVIVNGNFDCKQVEVKDIKINGNIKSQDIKVAEIFKCNGNLEIINGDLNILELFSKFAILINVLVKGNIFFKSFKNNIFFYFFENKKNILTLSGNSIVYGDIIFEDKGEIHLYDDSKIKGQVINGIVLKK